MRKKIKERIHLTCEGKWSIYSTLVSGLLSYIIISLIILGEFSEKVETFLTFNAFIIIFPFIALLSYVITYTLTGNTEDWFEWR